MSTLIIDYGLGNLLSVKRAIEKCKGNVIISQDPKDINQAERIILPGVGTFKDGMNNLTKQGWVGPIIDSVLNRKVPIMGICLGMQLLATKGFEGGETNGLNLINGEVRKIERINQEEKVPHVGWNEVEIINYNTIFNGIDTGTDFYFVHSYEFIPQNRIDAIATTPYCGSVVSAISNDNIYGVQFHPEKSHKPGFKLIKNFLDL